MSVYRCLSVSIPRACGFLVVLDVFTCCDMHNNFYVLKLSTSAGKSVWMHEGGIRGHHHVGLPCFLARCVFIPKQSSLVRSMRLVIIHACVKYTCGVIPLTRDSEPHRPITI